MGLWPVRAMLWGWLFTMSVILLGLTAYRIHYTKSLDLGDISTTNTHFYDAVVVELLVTSCLAIIFSIWFIVALCAKLGCGPVGSFAFEWLWLFIIWIMFLVGGAVFTHDFHNLKWCRRAHKVCRILESIKAFTWICFAFVSFLIIASIVDMFMKKRRPTDPAHGRGDSGTYPATPARRRDETASHPDTRQTNTGGSTQPATHQTTTTETIHTAPVPGAGAV